MKPKTVGRETGGLLRPDYAQEMCHGIPVGLQINTSDGALPVEFLSAGDRIVTRNGGMTQLLGIAATTKATRGVKFTAGSLGDGMPEADVVLPADQPVLIRGWRARVLFGQAQAMCAAGHLVDGEFIQDAGPRRMVLFRLEFDRPRIFYGSGIELGSEPQVSQPMRAVA